MPWKETSPMEQRVEFVLRWIKHETGMAELCRAFGISRKTGYQLVARYEAAGLDGLKPHSRAPHHHPTTDCIAPRAGTHLRHARGLDAARQLGDQADLPRLDPDHPHLGRRHGHAGTGAGGGLVGGPAARRQRGRRRRHRQ